MYYHDPTNANIYHDYQDDQRPDALEDGEKTISPEAIDAVGELIARLTVEPIESQEN